MNQFSFNLDQNYLQHDKWKKNRLAEFYRKRADETENDYYKGNEARRQEIEKNARNFYGETVEQHIKDLRKQQKFYEPRDEVRMANLEYFDDRDKGINMVKFDIDRAKKKVSSALNKLKNIKL